MKNFEERYTAWLDGTMDDRERERFEAELPDREAAFGEAAGWKKLSGLWRESMVPSAMPHGDFLNSQVMTVISRETPMERPAPAKGWFPVGRLAWSGAFLLAIAALMSVLILPSINKRTTNEQFISQVVKARAGGQKSPEAYTFAAPGGKGAVLWIDDAGDIPANERLK